MSACVHGFESSVMNCPLCAGPRDRQSGNHAHMTCVNCGGHCGTPYFTTDAQGFTVTLIVCDYCQEIQ